MLIIFLKNFRIFDFFCSKKNLYLPFNKKFPFFLLRIFDFFPKNNLKFSLGIFDFSKVFFLKKKLYKKSKIPKEMMFLHEIGPDLNPYSYFYPSISGNIASKNFGFFPKNPPCSSPDESQILCENIESNCLSQKKSTRGGTDPFPPRLRVTI